MSEVSAESWLTQEAEDLLDQGNVGLYQFIWGLRGASFGLSDDVERLVRAGKARIYALAWPGLDVVEGPLPVETLADPKSWSEGESGPLTGLVPTD
jgi:hypothetical protein